MTKNISCPCCNGTGTVEIDETKNPRMQEITKLPKDSYCPTCKQMVTKTHSKSYNHTIFPKKIEAIT